MLGGKVMTKSLQDSVSVLKGVGPSKVTALNKLGINTIEELLTYYPFRYDDMAVKELAEVADGQKVTLKGIVASQPTFARFGRSKNRLNFRFLVEHDIILVTFFNQPYLRDKVENGQEIIIYGKYNAKRQQLSGMKILGQTSQDFAGIYRANKDIKALTIKKIVEQAFNLYQDCLVDILPTSLRQKFRLESRRQMIHDMHFPASQKAEQLARRSAIFEEFFLFQLRLQYLKKVNKKEAGLVLNYDSQKIKAFSQTLPFELTTAQKKVVNEICHDLHRPLHMNRLLQGDVGSGKTVVAALALYATVTAGYQGAMMVPTEILAQQHAEKLQALFEKVGVNIALMTSSTLKTKKARQTSLAALAQGDIDVVVGTQALIQDDINFHKLGLVVTDEQHRFGVRQRQILREKGENPDVLAMTATPIPRTLAITAYGEMDVSIIDTLPAGRQPIKTMWLKKSQLNEALQFINQQLATHSQAYVVSPLIEESEMMDLQNAQETYEKLREYYAGRYQVGLLHGRMTAEEKDQTMQDFKDGKFDLLVSTTVIEVGVDVPNATVMLILDADRFGLAQLHQLRGRVGRGQKASYCLLLADPKSDYGRARMETMVQTQDGFVIAQKDLELRGPGDILGSKQAGIPDFAVGDPIQDFKILQIAQIEAHDLLEQSDFTTNSENQGLWQYLRESGTLEENFD
ncbi:ATP-dependent DNA helicase [Ligilactobacillus equi DSM 15833 = JCM 10991]|uniref:ATP-dependent DNA helicase RecG n=2 Tax=Ligilactobacillus equi TaxID=137357 RepID=A0A0R1T7G1_9LACO|nr:ATP-dependent DNA helicase [Ligilactobacillus equi DSM 15833 = JCM 10991]